MMAKIGSGFFYSLSVDPASVCDDAKYSVSSQQTQINLINPKLLLCCSWKLVTRQFFLIEFHSMQGMELQEKYENQRGDCIKNPAY